MTDRQSVLICEDDELLAGLLVNVVETAGFHAIAAAAGPPVPVGLSAAVVDYPAGDLALAEFVRLLRAHNPGLPIVGISGLPRSADFAAAGVDLFLLKPFAMSELVALLHDVTAK